MKKENYPHRNARYVIQAANRAFPDIDLASHDLDSVTAHYIGQGTIAYPLATGDLGKKTRRAVEGEILEATSVENERTAAAACPAGSWQHHPQPTEKL